jgi:hypothetical protein
MTEEDEAFNDIERQAKQRKESVRAALKSQEPIAWHYPDGLPEECTTDKAYAEKEPAWTPMYYKHEWVGLTDEERSELVTLHHGWNEYGQAIEAKLKEKNT